MNHCVLKRMAFVVVLLALSMMHGCGLERPEQGVEPVENITINAIDKADSPVGELASNVQIPVPAVAAYKKEINDVLASDLPVILLQDIDEYLYEAQMLAILDSKVQRYFYLDKNKQQALRNEVMTVRKTLPSDLTPVSKDCYQQQCARVNIYNFYFNATTSVVVNLLTQKVLSISTLPESQPDISPTLTDVAIAIAKASPLARQALYSQMSSSTLGIEDINDIQPVMAEIKSALRDTLCERSKHLCVAPTYIVGDKALWVIVDLTDFRVVGVRWTELRNSGPPVIITERILENDYVFHNFCETVSTFTHDDWNFQYSITGSDGLEVSSLTYQGKPVLQSAKLVDWHVSYSRKDSFGYSDAIGCPLFSSAVVVAHDGPKQKDIIVDEQVAGFAFVQDFRQHPWPAACNYRYEQRYEFYNDGSFRIVVGNLGRGCGDDGTYRPVIRMQFNGPSSIEQWSGESWVTWHKEQWSMLAGQSLKKNRFSHRIKSHNHNDVEYLLEPGNGQFNDGGRGDNAFIYASVLDENNDEGVSDLVTLGSCCNADYQQGPEKFLEPAESLEDKGLVLWYVAQMKNDGRKGHEYCWSDTVVNNGVKKVKVWPCYAGPMLTPYNSSSEFD